ncbi:hypothetical protein [Bordetella sp. 15P40C-2]|nr:hypothetical protein [Bordetella sp. 15P40C-2]
MRVNEDDFLPAEPYTDRFIDCALIVALAVLVVAVWMIVEEAV